MMQRERYLSGALSVSRFNRRLHALGDWLRLLLETLGELFATGRGVPARQHAGAGLPPRPRPPLPQGARAGVLRLLRGQAREGLRLAAAPGLHPGRACRWPSTCCRPGCTT